MGSVTDIIRKSRLTPVVLVGASFVLGNLSVFLVSSLKEKQAKAKTGAIDMYDWGILLAGMGGCIAINIASYMNKGYTRYADERDAEHKAEKANGAKPPVEADGGNLR